MIEENSRTPVQGLGYTHIKDVELNEVREFWDGQDYGQGKVNKEIGTSVVLEFYGGNVLHCSPDHYFMARTSSTPYSWTKAENLTLAHKVLITNTTPKFDFFPVKQFPLLGQMNSSFMGLLIGTYYKFGKNSPKGFTLTLPERDFELVRFIKVILRGLDLPVDEDCLYKASGNLTVLSVESLDLLEELTTLDIKNGLKQPLWASKPALQGIVSLLFAYSSKTKENFELKLSNENLTKDLQQVLFLFGVSANIVKGLMKYRLVLTGNNVYKYYLEVGFIDEEKALSYINEKKLKRFKRNAPSNIKVKQVRLTDLQKTMYYIDTDKFVTNGIVTRNCNEEDK